MNPSAEHCSEVRGPRSIDGCGRAAASCGCLRVTGAPHFGEYEGLTDELAGAELLVPELAGNTSVYYLNMPRLFIGGKVWDPIANEIIEGAKGTSTCPGGMVW